MSNKNILREKINVGLEKIASSKSFKLFDRSSLAGKVAFWAIVPGSTYILATYCIIKYSSNKNTEQDNNYDGKNTKS